MRAGRALAAVALCALTAACGSTVQVGSGAPVAATSDAPAAGTTVAAGGDGGLTLPGAAPVGGASGALGSTGATTTVAGTAGSRPTTTVGATTTGGTTSAATVTGSAPAGTRAGPARRAALDGADPPRLRGAEGATTITNGLGTEVSFGDGQRQAQAVVDDLNARGGISGRPIEPYYSAVDVTAADPNAEYVATCTELTEDKGVVAILTPINPPEAFVACVANHQMMLIDASFAPGDRYLYEQFGAWFYSPTLLNLDSGLRLTLEAARASGDLEGAQVGVIYYADEPVNVRVVDGTVRPTLQSWGITPEEIGIVGPEDVPGAQLRFAALGIDVVIFVTPNGIGQLLFMQTAENQAYRPIYWTGDSDSTRFVSENVAEGQAQNIRGVGSLPISNVRADQYPTTPAEQACLDITRAGGEDNRDRLTNVTATLYCELVYEFATIAANAGPTLTGDTFRAAYATSSYTPISTFGVDLANGYHDNAAFARPYAWDPGCACLTYTGAPFAIAR